MQFVLLDEIVDVLGADGSKKKNIITKPIYVKTGSINAFKKSCYGSTQATQLMMQNDCIWVTNSPKMIMKRCGGYMSEDFEVA